MENENSRFDIALVHNELRETQSWVLSEQPVSDDDISCLQIGHWDTLGMMIQEKPLLVFPVEQLPKIGVITDNTAFVHPKHVDVPMLMFLINSQLLDVIEGKDLFDKLSQLEPLLSDTRVTAQEMLLEYHLKYGFHCIGVKHAEKA